MAKSFTLYKLIILYMLNQVDFPLTNSQISEFILDKGYTTYFKLQQAYPNFWNRDLSEKSLHITVHLPSYGGWCRDNPLFHQRYLTCDPA